MSEIEFITDQLKRSFDGEAWHGPAVMEVLNDVDAKTAAARPIHAGHSIWELVLHLSAWKRIVAERIARREAIEPTDEENFPHVAHPTDAAWREALQTLRANHNELLKVASGLTDARLNDRVPGKDYDIRFMLTGAVQHAAYHGGQIALLKRARA